MKSFFSFLILSILILSCSENQDYITVQKKIIVETVFASGIVKPHNLVEIHSSVTGIVTSIHISEGDSVSKGSILFDLKSNGNEFLVNSAQANRTFADNASALNSPQLATVQVDILAASQRFSYDSSLFTKKQQLFKAKAISSQELETSRLSFQTSKAQFNSSKLRLESTKRSLLRDKSVSKAQYNVAKSSADNFRISSLTSGYVWSVIPKIGANISPSQTIALIGAKNSFLLTLDVEPSDIGLIKVGQKVVFTIDAVGDSIFQGYVSSISSSIDDKTQMYEIEVETPNLSITTIKSSIEANIIIAEKKNAKVIPRKYLYGTNIYISKNGDKPILTPVKIGLKNFEMVEILEASVSEGTKIYQKPL